HRGDRRPLDQDVRRPPARRPGAPDQPASLSGLALGAHAGPCVRAPVFGRDGFPPAATSSRSPALRLPAPLLPTSGLSASRFPAACLSASFSATPCSPVPSCSREPLSNRYNTAIRTETPFVTCSTIVDLGESATSAAISTPLFIGPGCITMAWSGRRAILSPSRPYLRLYSRTLG